MTMTRFKSKTNRAALCTALTVLTAAGLLIAGLHRTMYARHESPDRSHYAEITYYTWQSWIIRMPGQGGDKPGFVEVFSRDGASLGRIPVDLINAVDIDWTETGAGIRSRGEWDFTTGACFYWDESGNNRIYVRNSK